MTIICIGYVPNLTIMISTKVHVSIENGILNLQSKCFKDFYGNFCVENLGAIWNINKFENIFCRWITGFSDIYLGCIKLLIKINDNKLQRFDLKVHNLLCLKQNIYESLRIMVELK